MVALIILGAAVAAVLLLLGARQFHLHRRERAELTAMMVGDSLDVERSGLQRVDRSFRRTRLGSWLARELALAGIDQRPTVVAVGGGAVALVAVVVLWNGLAPLFGVLGLVVGVLAVRVFLARGRARRLEAFVGQLPELARVLANATNAGLSINTAIGIAGDELDDPARSEMQRVADRLSFGAPLATALREVHQRLASREVAVLVSTLVVSARSGGSLVTALRDIAGTLETRKETRREIRTTLAQSRATSYLVAGMGVAILFGLNAIQPGTVDAMLGSWIGRGVLLVSGLLFVAGFLVTRQMTRIDL